MSIEWTQDHDIEREGVEWGGKLRDADGVEWGGRKAETFGVEWGGR